MRQQSCTVEAPDAELLALYLRWLPFDRLDRANLEQLTVADDLCVNMREAGTPYPIAYEASELQAAEEECTRILKETRPIFEKPLVIPARTLQSAAAKAAMAIYCFDGIEIVRAKSAACIAA